VTSFHARINNRGWQIAQNFDRRLLKKDSEARRAFIVILSVKRDREIGMSTTTTHEHEFKRGSWRNAAYESFFSSLLV
jgi:hypothetical protein